MSQLAREAPSRCPRCAAGLAPGAQWCSLCYADLRPAPDPPPARQPAAEATPVPRGRHSRAADSAAEPHDVEVSETDAVRAAIEARADAMLDQLRDSAPDGLGRFGGRFSTPASRVGLMLGGTAVALMALILVMTLLGSVLS